MRGWRLFHCEICYRTFWRATRDHLTASVDACTCGELQRPINSIIDTQLEDDMFGNLTNVPPDKVLEPPC